MFNAQISMLKSQCSMLKSQCSMQKRNPAAITRNRANERRKWYLQESNRGHTDFQSDALPTELRHQFRFFQSRRFVKAVNRAAILSFAGAKVRTFFGSTKFFHNFFQKKSFLLYFIADSTPEL